VLAYLRKGETFVELAAGVRGGHGDPSLDDSRWCRPWHAKAGGLVMDLVSGFRDGDGPAAGPVAGGSTGPRCSPFLIAGTALRWSGGVR
jgi:hypothetical protein